MHYEKILLNEKRNVNLTILIQDVDGEFQKLKKRPAVLVLPGGAYAMCSDREAEPVAFAYAKAGYQTFILRYSVGEHNAWPNPLNDYENAMEMIRSKTDEWHVYEDKIAVIGFSAGGHLAGCAATISKNRPNAAILGYAALSKEFWDSFKPAGLQLPSPIQEVDNKTCPCFLFAARDDLMVPVSETLKFEMALSEHNISFESHIYAYGSHGFSIGESYLIGGSICSRLPHWVQDSIDWLKDVFGDFGEGEMTNPTCAPKVIGDEEDYLSIDCTINHLKTQGAEALSVLEPIFEQLNRIVDGYKNNGVDINPLFKYFRLRDILEALKIPKDEIVKIQEKLSHISNIKS